MPGIVAGPVRRETGCRRQRLRRRRSAAHHTGPPFAALGPHRCSPALGSRRASELSVPEPPRSSAARQSPSGLWTLTAGSRAGSGRREHGWPFLARKGPEVQAAGLEDPRPRPPTASSFGLASFGEAVGPAPAVAERGVLRVRIKARRTGSFRDPFPAPCSSSREPQDAHREEAEEELGATALGRLLQEKG